MKYKKEQRQKPNSDKNGKNDGNMSGSDTDSQGSISGLNDGLGSDCGGKLSPDTIQQAHSAHPGMQGLPCLPLQRSPQMPSPNHLSSEQQNMRGHYTEAGHYYQDGGPHSPCLKPSISPNAHANNNTMNANEMCLQHNPISHPYNSSSVYNNVQYMNNAHVQGPMYHELPPMEPEADAGIHHMPSGHMYPPANSMGSYGQAGGYDYVPKLTHL